MIEMKDVWKTYSNGVIALHGISVYISRGEFIYVVGPSGAGKSTFIKMMYREEKPSSGEIFIGETNLREMKANQVPFLRRNMGIVFQDFKLLPAMTVFENIAFAMEVIEAGKENIKKRVMQVLDIVHLKNKAKFMPHELSGGEQQRISIARAIVNSPGILIADEPTGNLDPDTSWEIMQLLKEINAQGTTVIMATHNRNIVNTMRNRVIAIENGRISRDEIRGHYGS